MDGSLHLRAADPQEGVVYRVLGTIFLAVIIVPSFWMPAVLWAGLAHFPMAAGAFWAAWRSKRLARRGVLLDEEGIGPAEDGVGLWTLPWSRYGGYRASPATTTERMRRPERGGYEIMDREGQPVFHLFMGGNGHAAQAVRHELDRRVPPDGFPFDPLQATNPRRGFVWGALLVSLLLTAFAVWGLNRPVATHAWNWGVCACIFAPGVFFAALMEGLSIRRKARGRLPQPRWGPPLLPEEGPGLERHLARHDRSPLKLEDGGRYRTVDPLRRREHLEANVKGVWAIPLGYVFAAFWVWIGLTDPAALPPAIGIVLLIGGLTTAGLPSIVSSRRMLEAVDDVLWVHEGALVVVRPGREPFTLPLTDASDRRALFRRSWIGATDVLRAPTGERYYLDRTRLYATPNPDLEIDV